jgi:hypothetical protein
MHLDLGYWLSHNQREKGSSFIPWTLALENSNTLEEKHVFSTAFCD